MNRYLEFETNALRYAQGWSDEQRMGQALTNCLGANHPDIFHQMSVDIWENAGITLDEREQVMAWLEEVQDRLSYTE